MLTQQEERDLFEGHIQKSCPADPYLRRLKSGEYSSLITERLWQCWQARAEIGRRMES